VISTAAIRYAGRENRADFLSLSVFVSVLDDVLAADRGDTLHTITEKLLACLNAQDAKAITAVKRALQHVTAY
jgi:hypothetical protein